MNAIIKTITPSSTLPTNKDYSVVLKDDEGITSILFFRDNDPVFKRLYEGKSIAIEREGGRTRILKG